jgi:hypothetical protein
MSDDAKTIEVNCPRCGRPRKIGKRTVAASMVGHKTGNAQRWLRCVTCKLLDSIYQHEAAIANLNRKVMERRMRGL